MGGLIPSWKNFHDEVNSVTRPVQMGPVWMHAGQVANRPIHHQIWMLDPPASSYPSCIAVKCAQLQSDDLGLNYLNLLRLGCMTNGKNISKQTVLFDLAEQLSLHNPSFDLQRFKDDYAGDAGMNAFRSDLDEVRRYNINRFPTLVVRWGAKAIVIAGHRQPSEVLQAIEQMNA
jgi:predicted DsbA family dithiol-disulfide isomerase